MSYAKVYVTNYAEFPGGGGTDPPPPGYYEGVLAYLYDIANRTQRTADGIERAQGLHASLSARPLQIKNQGALGDTPLLVQDKPATDLLTEILAKQTSSEILFSMMANTLTSINLSQNVMIGSLASIADSSVSSGISLVTLANKADISNENLEIVATNTLATSTKLTNVLAVLDTANNLLNAIKISNDKLLTALSDLSSNIGDGSLKVLVGGVSTPVTGVLSDDGLVSINNCSNGYIAAGVDVSTTTPGIYEIYTPRRYDQTAYVIGNVPVSSKIAVKNPFVKPLFYGQGKQTGGTVVNRLAAYQRFNSLNDPNFSMIPYVNDSLLLKDSEDNILEVDAASNCIIM
jgi:hypothetical protein